MKAIHVATVPPQLDLTVLLLGISLLVLLHVLAGAVGLRWLRLPAGTAGRPSVAGDAVYTWAALGGGYRMVAVNAADGQTVALDAVDGGYSQPAISDGVIYAVAGDSMRATGTA